MSMLIARSSATRQESQKTSQQIENGRYATQVLADDLRMAGYYGEFNPPSSLTPASIPDPSLTTVADLTSALPLAVQGYHNGASLPAGLSSILTDIRTSPPTDVLVVRRASSCIAGAPGCACMPGLAGCPAAAQQSHYYFQTPLCANQLSNLTASQFIISSNPAVFSTNNGIAGSTPSYFAAKDCVTMASVRSYRTNIYYVSNNHKAGDGIPTLNVAELTTSGFTVTPLVEGIDSLQFEYGQDTDGNGSPDQFSSTLPDAPSWKSVTAVRIHVLARNTLSTTDFTDSRYYNLGATSIGPFNDNFKRHVYNTFVRLTNVAQRFE
ncbi:PilW family protein [Rhodoferax sp. GW822-FHT02A01]|uniref:PilW family protein n=1 Tax=Rhodoferax sp. GW822-FHT02A01 TaxID=3141537 RepID=UPI00315DEF0D